MPLFSIIIPTFNSSKTIDTAIQSILQQSFTDFEICIVDGLSADNTLEILRGFNDNRIKISTEKDEGIYDAMNKGIEKAEGEWLYFLGSDDKLKDLQILESIEKIVQYNDVDFVYGNVIMSKDNSVYDGRFDIEKLYTCCNICHQAIFYKKSLFNKIGNYNLNYKVWADWDLNIRCFSNPLIRILYTDKLICVYNNESGHSMLADERFEKIIASPYIIKIASLESKIENLQSYIANIHDTKTHRIGNTFLYPFRVLQRLFFKR